MCLHYSKFCKKVNMHISFVTDKHYTEAFLLIYPTFVTHQELINKLVHRLVIVSIGIV